MAIIYIIAVTFCVFVFSAIPVKAELTRILIVGNSYVRYYPGGKDCDVKLHLENMCKVAGREVYVEAVVHGGARLKYYAGLGKKVNYKDEFLKTLKSEDWDYVIVNDYSRAPYLAYKEETVPAVKWIKKSVKRYSPDARLLLYMTPYYDYKKKGKKISGYEMEQTVAAAYQTLGEKYDLDVIPVGMQFYRVETKYPRMRLLGPDNKHPNKKGFYLIASCMYYEMFGKKPPLKEEVYKMAGLTRKQAKRFRDLLGSGIETENVTVTLKVGETYTMKVTDIRDKKLRKLRYHSMKESVAQVDAKTGVIRAVKKGTALIVAETADGKQAFCNVTVKKEK